MAEPNLQIGVVDTTLQELLTEQALVAWHDNGVSHHLGRLSEANNGKAKLTLYMGCDGSKLLINFHLPVKTRPSISKITKHMYLVVPAEHLRITVDEITPDKTPDTTQTQLRRDGVLLSDILARVHFTLAEPAFAVMPVRSRGAERSLLGAPRQLLLHLKSLSETNEFVVYLRRSALDKAHAVSTSLSDGKAETPALRLATIYGRGCSGVKNAWEQYSCNASNASTCAWNPLVDENPPPYEAIAPVHGFSARGHAEPAPVPHDPLGQIDDHESLGWATDPKPHPVFKDADGIRVGTTSPRGTKRKCDSPPPEDSFRGSTTDADSIPSDPAAAHHLADAITLESSAQRSLLRRNPNLNWALLTRPDLHAELQDFLLGAWKHDPIAHETYRSRMLDLGACVRENDVARFDREMGECQAGVVTAAQSGSPPMWMPADPVEQVGLMREWLNEKVCRNAGTLMLDLLVGLQGEAVAAKTAAGDVMARERFYLRKATCLAAAFYLFGGRLHAGVSFG